MKVQVEDVSSIEKRLSIEVDPSLVEKELTAAYSNLSRQVKVPGFRPGKIPRRILEQKFKSEVEADVVKRVQLLGFIDALKETNVAAVGDPSFSGGKIEAQKPFSYSARVEVKPVVSAKDYKGLELPKFELGVTDERVTEQLDRMLGQRTQVIAVEGRDVVQKGDLVVIDFDATKEGAAFPGNTGRDVTIEVLDGELIEGNLPQLEGAKLGGTKELDYKFPDDYRVEEIKGQTAHFVVTIKEIKQKKVPPLDDAFAKEMGEETAEALKARIRRDLEKAAKNRVEVDERDALFKALIEKNPIEVPTAMVNRGVDFMLENALGSLMRSGMDPNMLQLDWGKLREELRPKATLEVRGQLILEAVAKEEKLEVADAEVDARLEKLATDSGVGLDLVKKQYQSAEARESLKNRTKEEKVIAFLKQHAKA
ncbi:MAG: trigger factor [Archangium sp.]|nr:trigger factor [Archangium sp.]MDP3151791.1 trigger factor [Archangium sp.]MDP3573309.1 trigger factor [Archangium sp.]